MRPQFQDITDDRQTYNVALYRPLVAVEKLRTPALRTMELIGLQVRGPAPRFGPRRIDLDARQCNWLTTPPTPIASRMTQLLESQIRPTTPCLSLAEVYFRHFA